MDKSIVDPDTPSAPADFTASGRTSQAALPQNTVPVARAHWRRGGRPVVPDPPRTLTRFGVRRLMLPADPHGKRPRLSLVVDRERGFPARLAMRWAVRRRLSGVSAKSIYKYNNVVAWIYDWAAFAQEGVGDLDLYFTEGNVLSLDQVRSLLRWIDTRGRPYLVGRIGAGFRLAYSEPEVILPKLGVVRSFLTFALDPAKRMGKPLPENLRAQALSELEDALGSFTPPLIQKDLKTPGGPLSDDEKAAIRELIGCAGGVIPTKIFSLQKAYRNWLLFEVNQATGFRAAELAALTLASLPPHLSRVRLRDDREADNGLLEEAGSKTFGRDIEVPEWLLHHLQCYVDEFQEPWGRRSRRGVSALWTTGKGTALSVRQIFRIFQRIGDAAGIRLTAHRGRHRFVDEILEVMPPDTAKELTGHSTVQGLKPYMHEKSRKAAEAFHRAALRRRDEELSRLQAQRS